jgi:hypothetical protein
VQALERIAGMMLGNISSLNGPRHPGKMVGGKSIHGLHDKVILRSRTEKPIVGLVSWQIRPKRGDALGHHLGPHRELGRPTALDFMENRADMIEQSKFSLRQVLRLKRRIDAEVRWKWKLTSLAPDVDSLLDLAGPKQVGRSRNPQGIVGSRRIVHIVTPYLVLGTITAGTESAGPPLGSSSSLTIVERSHRNEYASFCTSYIPCGTWYD